MLKKNKWKTSVVTLLGVLLIGSVALQAQQVLYLQNANDFTWRSATGYSAQDPNQYFEAVNFDVYNSDSVNSYDYTVMFDEGGHTTGQGDYVRYASDGTNQIQYKLMKIESTNDGNLLKDCSSAGECTGSLSLKNVYSTKKKSDALAASSTVQLTYYATLTTGQSVPAGTYTDTFNIKLYNKKSTDITGETDGLEQTVAVTITITVQPVLQVNLLIQDTLLDFGQAAAGDTLDFNITVISNVNYDVLMKSQNGSVMKNISHTSSQTTIPFDVRLKKSGNPPFVDLIPADTYVTMYNTGTPTTAAGDDFLGTVQIKSTYNPAITLSGTYQDTLTLEVLEK